MGIWKEREKMIAVKEYMAKEKLYGRRTSSWRSKIRVDYAKGECFLRIIAWGYARNACSRETEDWWLPG